METLITFDNKKHLLHMPSMDETHREFVELFNNIDIHSNNSFKDNMLKVLHHTKRHFEKEEILMDRYGYPRKKEHKDEHNKVLSEMAYFLEISRSVFGLKMLKSYYIQKLPEWFDLHLMNMDRDLAHFLTLHSRKQVN